MKSIISCRFVDSNKEPLGFGMWNLVWTEITHIPTNSVLDIVSLSRISRYCNGSDVICDIFKVRLKYKINK